MNKNGLIAVAVIFLLIIGMFFVVFTNNDTKIDDDSHKKDESGSDDETPPALGNITSFDEAVNAFNFDFYRKLCDNPANTGNIFYSPYSIFTALAMTYEGAKGLTAEEMKDVLHVDQSNDSFHLYMQSLYEYLNTNSKYNISTANALWVKENYELLQDYENIITTYYGGEATNIDFSDPVAAADTINQWVEDQTNNLIKDLVPAGAIDPVLTMLILTNAIYFKGNWEIQFDEQNTTEREFTKSDDSAIMVDTMSLVDTEDRFNYTENDDFQMLELPYSGGDISMIIMLPKDGRSVDDIISTIDKDDYAAWIDEMYDTELDIYLPKFKIETSYNLNDYLTNLGMTSAFNEMADFSGIFGDVDIFISDVIHKAFVEVNEEGTEAAAATAIIMAATAYPGIEEPARIVFDCDHPFLFTIHHKETNTILFMGTVEDPSVE